jgi:hypothetical protein
MTKQICANCGDRHEEVVFISDSFNFEDYMRHRMLVRYCKLCSVALERANAKGPNTLLPSNNLDILHRMRVHYYYDPHLNEQLSGIRYRPTFDMDLLIRRQCDVLDKKRESDKSDLMRSMTGSSTDIEILQQMRDYDILHRMEVHNLVDQIKDYFCPGRYGKPNNAFRGIEGIEQIITYDRFRQNCIHDWDTDSEILNRMSGCDKVRWIQVRYKSDSFFVNSQSLINPECSVYEE